MTRKDYVRIARALRKACSDDHPLYLPGVYEASDYIAVELKEDNPSFDTEHFFAVVRGDKPPESRPLRKKETK